MARGIYNPEGEFLRELYKRKREEETTNEPPETEEERAKEEPGEEEAARKKMLEKIEQRHERIISREPDESIPEETGKSKPDLQDRRARKVSIRVTEEGTVQTVRRGHRYGGVKPKKHGRETIRHREAA